MLARLANLEVDGLGPRPAPGARCTARDGRPMLERDRRPRPKLAYPPSADPPIDLAAVVRLADFEVAARERLHPAAWEYYAGGAGDEHTLRACIEAWDAFRLRPRVLVDVSAVDASTTILGRQAALPIGMAPAALHGMAHAEGEMATARAATAAGVLHVLSTAASQTIEESPRPHRAAAAGSSCTSSATGR